MSRKPGALKVISSISRGQFPVARVAAASWGTVLIQGQAK